MSSLEREESSFAQRSDSYPSTVCVRCTVHDCEQPMIEPNVRIGAVSLNVADLERMVDFYSRVVGLAVQEQRPGSVALGTIVLRLAAAQNED